MAKFENPPAAPARVLIIKPSALGDVVTAMPVLRGLRRSFPQARISWLLSEACAPLVRHDSQLDEVIIFERRRLGRAWRSPSAARALADLLRRLRTGEFDWVIDLQGLLRSGLLSAACFAPVRAGFAEAREGARYFYTHRVDGRGQHTVDRNIALARALGVDARAEDMTLQLSAGAQAAAERTLRENALPRGGFLVCVPPTTWPTKLYPVRHWRSVVAAMTRRMPVVLTGGRGDAPLCSQVADGLGRGVTDMSGRTTVDEMAALIAASAGVVCCDSAANFIAPAVGVQCVTLIGPTKAERTGPYRAGRAIVADIPCQGCLKRRCSHITCMQSIQPGQVIAAAAAMLETPAR